MKRVQIKSFGTKQYLIAGAIVALAVALLVGGLLMKGAGKDSQLTDTGSQVATDSGDGTAATSPTSGEPAPVAPQKESVALAQVSSPPQHTLAFVNADEYSADSEYQVTFVPYGTGPQSNSLIIQVLESRATGNVAKPFDFVGRNVLVDTSALSAKTISKGGTYTGVIKLVKQQSGLDQGGVLAPMLIEAEGK